MTASRGPAPSRVSPLFRAAEVPRWAASFYCRHFVWIAGISLIPAAQRAVSQLWRDRLPTFAEVGLEGLTLATRVLLFGLIFRAAIGGAPDLSADERGYWRRAAQFARKEWQSLAIQFGMFLVVAVIFKVIPDMLIAPRIPPGQSRFYWAAVLALKNPTIIAFTMVWIVGAIRQMLSPDHSLPVGGASHVEPCAPNDLQMTE